MNCACIDCCALKENESLRNQLAEKDRMIETLMREPRIDREAKLRAALAKAKDQSFWIAIAERWRSMAVKFALEIKESGDAVERCAVLVESMPSMGLYRVGGGFHAPSYDDAWMVAARMIRSELGEKKNPINITVTTEEHR